MEKKDSLVTHEPGWLKDFTNTEHESLPHFAPEQMIECAACCRTNPPTRLDCFYCGARLEISEKNAKLVRPIFRKLENWEKGFNVVCVFDSSIEKNAPQSKDAALFLGIEPEIFKNIARCGFPLPVSRLETAEEAKIVETRLRDYNLNAFVVPDEDLLPDKLPKRVRALSFSDDLQIRFTGTDESQSVNWQDLIVFVEGRIFESKREGFEKRKRGEREETGDASEFSTDERVLDFYDSRNRLGYRISAKSFDFSCLGAKKSLLANENFEILLGELKRLAPEAGFDRNYKNVRPLLNVVWTPDERKDSTGLQHAGVGKINLGSTVTVNNQNQFNCYSRLVAFWKNGQK
jgi:hypothetical protein